MMQGLKFFVGQIKKAGNKTCLRDIVRIKNGFEQSLFDETAATYADVKINIFIHGQYGAIIAEVQVS